METIQAKIDELAASLHKQVEQGLPVDANRIQQLIDMRRDRDVALAAWEGKRFDEMRNHTRELTAKIHITAEQMKLNSQLIEKIHEEQDKYDIAAVEWVRSGVCPWHDSEAASIAAGILVLSGEVTA